MDEFIINDPEIADSGTSLIPVFCKWIQGKFNSRGKKAIIKINRHFYEMYIARKGKKWWAFRCGKHRDGCGYRLQIKPINGDVNLPDFWERENWVIIPGSSPQVHTCQSLDKSDLSNQQYHNYVRKNMNEGITDYETIRIKSGIDEKYAQESSLYGVLFMFGNINSPTLNQIYLEQYPNAMNILNVL